MRRQKRSVFTTLLLLTFLAGAWGNVIAAAFCPRYASNRSCSIKHIVHQPKQVDSPSSCHHEMAGMEMDGMQMETEAASDSQTDSTAQTSEAQLTSDSSSDQVALDLPIEQCPHCWSHSQPTSGSVTTVAVDPSKRLVETDSPPAALSFVSLSAVQIFIIPSEHGPPGTALSRHVLINVFRI